MSHAIQPQARLMLEVQKEISVIAGQVSVKVGLMFQDEQGLLDHLNALVANRQIPNGMGGGMRTHPGFDKSSVERYIRTGAVVARQVDQYGQVTPVRPGGGMSHQTPPTIGESMGDQQADAVMEAHKGGQLGYPNGSTPLSWNPANLGDKDLDELNQMAINEGGASVQDLNGGTGFSNREQAVAYLSSNFRG